MTNENSLSILSLSKNTGEFYKKILKEILPDNINMNFYSIEQNVKGPIDSKVVLTTHKILLDKAEKIFPDSIVINSEKVLVGNNLEKIIIQPKDTKILVVASPEIVAREIITNLISYGIDHLDYHIYKKNSNINLKKFDIAISPGMIHLCPNEIKHKIDIGERVLSIVTFMKILEILNIDFKYLNKYINIYINKLIKSSKKIVDIYEKSEKLKNEKNIVLNFIEEGIISTKNNIVKSINPQAVRLLEINSDCINKNIFSIFNNFKIENISTSGSENKFSDFLLTNRDKQLICSKTILFPLKDSNSEYIYTIKEVSKVQKLEQAVRKKLSKKGLIAKYTFQDIIGTSKQIKKIKEKSVRLAKTDLPILILGESGTGKELLSQAIHNFSARKNKPFVAVNFASIPENLIESELFGYEEGAFTGSKKGGKQGMFELAHGGTLFLDEIGDAPKTIQSRLLRVLQEKEIMRLGGTNIIPVNTRIIAATNKDLLECVQKKEFRNDLYFRLNVLPINIPPLRERTEDIFSIINHFFNENDFTDVSLKNEVKDVITNYNWPGNVRELLNVLNYIESLNNNNENISINDLPHYLTKDSKSVIITKEKHESENKLKYLKHKLLESGNLNEIHCILKFLNSNRGYCIGRNRIRKNLMQDGYSLTDYRVKKYMNSLDSLNLISIGTTRQGSQICSLGIKLLDEFNNIINE